MKWINIKDKRPPLNEDILFFHPGVEEFPKIFVGIVRYWFEKIVFYQSADKENYLPISVEESITHWMSLPKPPET